MRNKKNWKQLVALAVSAVMLIPAQVGYAAGGADARIEVCAANREADGFEIEDGVLTKYTGTATEVVIPDNVTSIGKEAFYSCSGLTSITIPSSVMSIGEGAFRFCRSLTDISIPSGVTSIDNYVFDACSNLSNVSIPASVTSIGDHAFDNCSSLTNVSIPAGVKSIGFAAFYCCNSLTSINIPSGLTSIGGAAFSGCSGLTSVRIPASVTSIGWEVLENCSGLESIVVEAGNTTYDSRGNCNAIIVTEGNWLMAGCQNTTIPEGVESIMYSAFSGCSKLKSIRIPASVTQIEDTVFSGCSELESIVVDGENEKYDSRGNCNAIIETESSTLLCGCKNTIIPESVTSIGDNAFADCNGLTDISIPSSVKSIGGSAFWGCSSLTSVNISKGVKSIREGAFSNCSSLTSINIPDGVTDLDSKVFAYCKNLKSISIPGSVVEIGYNAFRDCYRLENVEIQDGVGTIGTQAFASCVSLGSINIPGSVAEIGSRAFSECYGLTDVIIQEGAVSIDDAFYRCRYLENIRIPESVSNIDNYAFQDHSEELTIYGKAGSYAETYASEKDIKFSAGEQMEPIEKKAISGEDVSISPESCVYNGEDQKPTVTVKDGDAVLKSGKDYIVHYNNNISIGTAEAIVVGISRYKGIIIKTFTITEPVIKELSQCTVTISQTSYTHDGTEKKPTVTVKDGNTVLKVGTDYTVEYRNNKDVGTAEVIVTGKGYFTGVVTKTFVITEKDTQEPGTKEVSKCAITVSPVSYVYDGKAKTPTVTVRDGNTVLRSGTDYTITYSDNTNAGTATVTVTGKGNYKGTVTKTFAITVKKNTSHNVGAYQYKVTGTSTVSVTAINDKKTTKVKVPGTVKIGGMTFKVTAIANNAFKKNEKITSVEIGDNVKTIGASVFEGCTKLTKVTVGKDVTEIGSSAFKNCKKLGTITVKSASLKKVGKNALKGIKATAKVKVPAKKLSAYKSIFKNKGQGKKVKITK